MTHRRDRKLNGGAPKIGIVTDVYVCFLCIYDCGEPAIISLDVEEI